MVAVAGWLVGWLVSGGVWRWTGLGWLVAHESAPLLHSCSCWLVGWLVEESGAGLVWAGFWPTGRDYSTVAVAGWLVGWLAEESGGGLAWAG